MKWPWSRPETSTGRVAAAEAKAEQHLTDAQSYLDAAEARAEEVRAKWPAIQQGRELDKTILKTNSLTARFMRQIHNGGNPA